MYREFTIVCIDSKICHVKKNQYSSKLFLIVIYYLLATISIFDDSV